MRFTQSGITLVGVAIGVAVMGIVVLGGASLIQVQSSSSRYMSGKSETFSLKSDLIRTMNDRDVCACHLNPNLTNDNSNDAALRFNTESTATLPRMMNLRRIREGCAVTDRVLAEEGMQIGEGLFIDRVEFTDMVPTGHPNQWRGRWRITFRPPPGGVGTPLSPVELFQFVYADAASVTANPLSATIDNCRGPVTPGLINGCPPNYSLVGGPNNYTSFCIHTNEQGPERFLDAKLACSPPPPGFGPAHMCTRNEWTLACQSNVDPTFQNGNTEWLPDNDENVALTVGNNNCNPVGFVDYNGGDGQTRHYRCCIK